MEREFINKDLNYEYYKLNSHDYNDYLFQLNDYEIEYRDDLNIDQSVTFGIEIEYEGIKQEIVDDFINCNYSDWESTNEQSISKGGEIISPILTNSKRIWEDIRDICSFLKNNNAITDNDAGAHLHVGTSILGDDIKKWHTFLGLYTAFENIIYKYASGEQINMRKNMKVYAYPIAIDLADIYKSIKATKHVCDLPLILDVEHKFQGLNLKNTNFDNPSIYGQKNTIEFRMPNGTAEEIIWQNNVNMFVHLLKAQINKDELAYIKNEINYIMEECFNYEYYNYIDPRKAFLFADIIFDNNLDKTNFLKQYIKDMKTTENTSPVYAKKFIKMTR